MGIQTTPKGRPHAQPYMDNKNKLSGIFGEFFNITFGGLFFLVCFVFNLTVLCIYMRVSGFVIL